MSDNLSRLRRIIQASYLRDETEYLIECLDYANASDALADRIHRRAFDLVSELRSDPSSQQGLDAFLSEYDLSSEEGVVLMCLAEALLRIPDADTADRLIRDKLSRGKWDDHLGQSESSLVNASTWGLMLTGKVIRLSRGTRSDVASFFRNLTMKAGEPVIRLAIKEAMGIMGQQFVLGETIERALQRSKQSTALRYHYSFDMLGEAALTSADADRFFSSYVHALETIGKEAARNAISVKLSALHPRIPIGALHQPHRDFPGICRSKCVQPFQYGQAALLVCLDHHTQTRPAFATRILEHRFEHVQVQLQSVGFLGIDGHH